jgi:hypothetical protein
MTRDHRAERAARGAQVEPEIAADIEPVPAAPARSGLTAQRGLAGHLGRPHLWIALCSMALVLSIGVVNSGRTSPGPLASPHARVSDLAGPNDCASCHGGLFQDMSGACLDCHDAIAEHYETGRGLHGRLASDQRTCASCHSDHHGESFAMVNATSFRKAGVPDVQAFDHASIGFEMRGAHLELDCTECHAHAFDDEIEEGLTRFIGLSQRCSSCHEDAHEPSLGTTCNSCHVQDSFDAFWARGHDEHLPLVGGHAGIGCRECHDAEGSHALEVLARGFEQPDARACLDCHDSPHGDAFAVGTARLASTSLEASCVVCHEAEHTSFRDEGLELSAAQHAKSGFPIDAPHDGSTCAECHDPGLLTFEARYPGRDRDSCAACHEDPHGGQFDTGPFAAEGCVACHGRERFEPHRFDVDLHARTALPLEGSHLEADCEACHEVAHAGEPRLFRGTSDQCASCHGDAHTGFFDSRTAEMEAVQHGDCARCHDATSFDAVDRDGFDHGRWTGFPLGGSHLVEGCESCHVPGALGDGPDAFGAEPLNEPPRRFGRVDPQFGDLHALHGGSANGGSGVGLACAACHADPHEGRFDGPGLPALFAEREGCARCHTDTSFRDLSLGFDHGLWTGFPLDGAHGAANCSDCHAPLRPATEAGRTWAPAAGPNCADCHQDPHGGQFDVPSAVAGAPAQADCAKCHGDTSSFAKLRFRHNWDSRFKLDETHAALDCAQCHSVEPIGGVPMVRYAPLGTECTDCHGVRAGSLRKGAEGR